MIMFRKDNIQSVNISPANHMCSFHMKSFADVSLHLCDCVFHTQTGSGAGALDDRVFAWVV